MPVGNLELVKSGSGSSVNTLTITDCFTADYDVYQINYLVKNVSNNTNIDIRLLNSSNAEITTAKYELAGLDLNAGASYTEVRRLTDTGWLNIGSVASDNEKGCSGVLRVYNPFDSSSYTFAQAQMGGWNTTTTFRGRKNIYNYANAEQCKGVKFYIVADSSYTMNIDAFIYGVK